MELATATRATEHETYVKSVKEHQDAIEAVAECVILIEELLNESPSFVQINKA